MDILKSVLKKLLHKAGYTLLKGDVKGEVQANAVQTGLPQHLLQNARVVASRYEVLKNLPRGGTAVEVGVAYGHFTQAILDALQPRQFIAIDTFDIAPGNEPWGQKTLEETGGSHYQYYTRKFETLINNGRMQVKRGLSWEVLATLPDASIDFLYVDADHTYQSVAKEIAAFTSKLKPGAVVQFNDYTYFDQNALMPFGVPKAVHEFMLAHNFEMLYLCLHPQGFYDVVVRKMLE